MYVALGDSYSAGEGDPVSAGTGACGIGFLPGTEEKAKFGSDGTTGCHRSPDAWAVQVWSAVAEKYALSFHACSGAVVSDFYSASHAYPDEDPNPQQSWLLDSGRPNPNVALVTFTFGGNDVGFADILAACVAGTCFNRLPFYETQLTHFTAATWPGIHTLPQLYADIRSAAPNARVIVVGYPNLFADSPPQSGCGTDAGTHFTEAEMIGVNQLEDEANRQIKKAAFAAGFEFADIANVMEGHDVCAKQNWINRVLIHSIQLSFHPNAGGQRAIAQRVASCVQSDACKPVSPTLNFKPFGLSIADFQWAAGADTLTIDPPTTNPYAGLWGAADVGHRCSTSISFDERLTSVPENSNYGFAVAPRSSVQNDQPAGASIQFEHEATPGMPSNGSFVRPAELPSGAWRVDIPPAPAADIAQPHHIEISAIGETMTMTIDGSLAATYATEVACGSIAIRAWGAGFSFSGIHVTP